MDVSVFDKYDFFTGVPDSLLKPLCDWLQYVYGADPSKHIVAANEGNAAAIAAGYHLATGKVPVVYLQNSGIGNILNPVASLLSDRIYGIPVLFIIGWRGEPGVHDEPQHLFQGEITLKLLEDMDIYTCIIGKDTTEDEFYETAAQFDKLFATGKSAAFVIQKGALSFDGVSVEPSSAYPLTREEAIGEIIAAAGDDIVLSTTGKASRELYELRDFRGEHHGKDFLTVGSMGHSSSIALGIALHAREKKIWCIDGDGAAIMHMGAMAVIGANRPKNLVHVVINNGAHESVGGMPTVANSINLPEIAKGCGYSTVASVTTQEQLSETLRTIKDECNLAFIEVKTNLKSRADLGRPKEAPKANKDEFMLQ